MKKSNSVTLKEACFDPKYSRGTWFCFIFAFINSNIGYRVLNMFDATV